MMSSKKKNNWAFLADFTPHRYDVNERSHFPTKNPKINPFVVKSLLESNCKRFRKSAIRENFNLKPETQLKKAHSNNGGNYTHQYNEVKEKLEPVSFIYVWTIFEHQVNDMNASQKVQGFSSLRRPETHFRHARGHQRAGVLTGSINIFQRTIITVYEVEHQKTINTKLGKQTIRFSEIIKDFYHYFQEEEAGSHKNIESKVALHS